jgi:hypothetical protein
MHDENDDDSKMMIDDLLYRSTCQATIIKKAKTPTVTIYSSENYGMVHNSFIIIRAVR